MAPATAADSSCPPDTVGVPLLLVMPLDSAGVPDGEYAVVVNGETLTFA